MAVDQVQDWHMAEVDSVLVRKAARRAIVQKCSNCGHHLRQQERRTRS